MPETEASLGTASESIFHKTNCRGKGCKFKHNPAIVHGPSVWGDNESLSETTGPCTHGPRHC